jgi:hypothetical protein
MKKSILLIVIAFFAITVFAQPLKKGNLVGVHVATVVLEPGVTMEQFKDYFINKIIPELNKMDEAVQIAVTEGIRGENANQFGFIYFIKSETDRNKYWNRDGSATLRYIDFMRTMQPYTDELKKLGTYTAKYTDWMIQ